MTTAVSYLNPHAEKHWKNIEWMIKNICMISKNYLYHIPYFIFIEKRETGREGRRGWEADEIFGVFGEVKGV